MKKLIGVAAVAAGLLYVLDGRRNPAMKDLESYRYAHRGLHDKPTVPENSLAGFKKAVDKGYGAEFDVHLLKDGNLAVVHDSDLTRVTGQTIEIEDLTTEDLLKYNLEGTSEVIPTFKEVLDTFAGKTPLIIELKTARGNFAELTDEVMKQLEDYNGLYCIESFDPKVVAYLKEKYPNIIRGQLSCDFMKSRKLPFTSRIAMTYLLTNVKGRPDFIAYDVRSRKNIANLICTKILKIASVSWTIKSEEELNTVEMEGSVPIFEQFDPGKKEC